MPRTALYTLRDEVLGLEVDHPADHLLRTPFTNWRGRPGSDWCVQLRPAATATDVHRWRGAGAVFADLG